MSDSKSSELLDLRGLMCPEPVLRTKKLFDNKEVARVEALVESDVNVENLKRLCRSLNLSMTANEDGEHYRVVIERTEGGGKVHEHGEAYAAAARSKTKVSDQKTGTVVFVTRDTLGEGDPDFGRNLLNVFLQTLLQSGHRPRAILLINKGVKLLDPEAATHKVLSDIKEAGIEVLACGLCVEFYGLKGKIATEQITNMFAIVEFLFAADRVLTP